MLDSSSLYIESNKNLLHAIEVLEKAQLQSQKIKEEKQIKNEGFWDKVGNIFNPFKCGKGDQ
jgi:hypothetical protein